MFQNRVLLTLCLLATLLISCKGEQLIPTPDLALNIPVTENTSVTDNEVEIEWVDCDFQTFQGEGQCGYLTVPVDYEQPKGETMQIAFVVYPSGSDDPKPDPIVFSLLTPLVEQSGFLPYAFPDWHRERDFVVIDPRGIGLSEPQVACSGFQSVWWDSLPVGGLTAEELGELHEQCRQSLESQRVPLDAYSAANIAADFKMLRTLLEYRQWNILSFGNVLAYEHLRADPDGIRGLILDSEVPVYSEQFPQYAAAEETLYKVFELCALDTDCNDVFPDLEETFYKVVEKLDAETVFVKIDNPAGAGRTEMQVDGNGFVEITLDVVGTGDLEMVAQLPRMIYQVYGGKNTTLEKMAGLTQGAPDSYMGWQWLLRCRQAPVADEVTTSAALTAISPALASYFMQEAAVDRAICSVWGHPDEPPSVHAPGTTPILLVTGEWDWRSSKELIEEFKKASSGAQVVTFPMTGSNIFFTRGPMECSQGLLQAFIDSPLAPLNVQCVPDQREITWITMP